MSTGDLSRFPAPPVVLTMMLTESTSAPVLGLLLIGFAAQKDPGDAPLAARIREGDREAFRQFYERHHAALFRYLRRRNTSAEVAEDLVQKAFLYIWEHRQRIDPEQSLRGYLFRIGYTRMLNHVRDTAPRDAAIAPDDRPGSLPTPEAETAYRDLHEALNAAIEQLPDRRREVFELCFVEDLTYREAADALDISPKTVESHMRHAFQDLREALKAYHPEKSEPS